MGRKSLSGEERRRNGLARKKRYDDKMRAAGPQSGSCAGADGSRTRRDFYLSPDECKALGEIQEAKELSRLKIFGYLLERTAAADAVRDFETTGTFAWSVLAVELAEILQASRKFDVVLATELKRIVEEFVYPYG